MKNRLVKKVRKAGPSHKLYRVLVARALRSLAMAIAQLTRASWRTAEAFEGIAAAFRPATDLPPEERVRQALAWLPNGGGR